MVGASADEEVQDAGGQPRTKSHKANGRDPRKKKEERLELERRGKEGTQSAKNYKTVTGLGTTA